MAQVFAQVTGKTVTYRGETTTGKAVHGFILHKTIPVQRFATWQLTLPCGACLGGPYRTQKVARAVANALAPHVIDWNGADLQSLFGSEAAARVAYDAGRAAMVGRV